MPLRRSPSCGRRRRAFSKRSVSVPVVKGVIPSLARRLSVLRSTTKCQCGSLSDGSRSGRTGHCARKSSSPSSSAAEGGLSRLSPRRSFAHRRGHGEALSARVTALGVSAYRVGSLSRADGYCAMHGPTLCRVTRTSRSIAGPARRCEDQRSDRSASTAPPQRRRPHAHRPTAQGGGLMPTGLTHQRVR